MRRQRATRDTVRVRKMSASFERPLAILSDMDGVLVDSERLHWESALEILHHFAPHARPTEERGWDDRSLWRRWRTAFQLPLSVDTLIQRRLLSAAARLKTAPPPLLPRAAALPSLCVTRGLSLAVVSASSREHIQLSLQPHGLLEGVDLIVSGLDDCAENKPAPDCYIQAAEQLQVPIERCWILEDSYTGLSAALASGAGRGYALPTPPQGPNLQKLQQQAYLLSELSHFGSELDQSGSALECSGVDNDHHHREERR